MSPSYSWDHISRDQQYYILLHGNGTLIANLFPKEHVLNKKNLRTINVDCTVSLTDLQLHNEISPLGTYILSSWLLLHLKQDYQRM